MKTTLRCSWSIVGGSLRARVPLLSEPLTVLLKQMHDTLATLMPGWRSQVFVRRCCRAERLAHDSYETESTDSERRGGDVGL